MQDVILGEQSFSLPTASANQSSREWFTARASLDYPGSALWRQRLSHTSMFSADSRSRERVGRISETSSELDLHVAPSDGYVFILSNDSRELSGILCF